MSTYYFATFHQKKTIPPSFKGIPHTPTPLPKNVQNHAMQARHLLITAFHDMYKNFITMSGDKELYARILQLSENYLRWVRWLTDNGHRHCAFFYWGESFAPRLNHAFADVTYDAAGVLWNLCCVEMCRANHRLLHEANSRNFEEIEKDAYTVLCTAAGRFHFIAELLAHVSQTTPEGAPNHTLLADMTPDFVIMMENIALGQAQEIGCTRQLSKETPDDDAAVKNHNRALLAKLCSQCASYYRTALSIAEKRIVCPTEHFAKLLLFLQIKCGVFDALAHSHESMATFDAKPEESLWHMWHANSCIQPVRPLATKANFDRYINVFLDAAESIVRHNYDRIHSMNELVVRAKAAAGPFQIPSPQLLARPKQFQMPEPAVIPDDAGVGDWELVERYTYTPPPAPVPVPSSSSQTKS